MTSSLPLPPSGVAVSAVSALGPVLRTVVISVKSLTPWASAGVAVSAQVHLEADDRAMPQDHSVLPVER